MTRADGNNVSLNEATGQIQISNDIENLVANKFVWVTERFIGQNHIIPNDHRILQATTFNQTILDEEFNFFKKAKGSCLGYILFPGFRVDFR